MLSVLYNGISFGIKTSLLVQHYMTNKRLNSMVFGVIFLPHKAFSGHFFNLTDHLSIFYEFWILILFLFCCLFVLFFYSAFFVLTLCCYFLDACLYSNERKKRKKGCGLEWMGKWRPCREIMGQETIIGMYFM